jgi:hypothetical protein
VFVQKYATFLEKEFVLETSSERKIKLNEVEEPQINIQMEQVSEAITFDTQLETKKTHELYRSGRTRYAQLRYQLLMKVDDGELLIPDELTNYMEAISNIDYEK